MTRRHDLALSVEGRILMVRGHRVMLDKHLAALYGVSPGALNRAVKRNMERFPDDFMFHLIGKETKALRCQTGILKPGRGQHRKYLPYAFTEQGVAMLSGVLRSKRAVLVNVAIMRAFVRLRRILATHEELSRKLMEMEKRYDAQFKTVFDAIRELMQPAEPPERRIGFRGGRTLAEGRSRQSQFRQGVASPGERA